MISREELDNVLKTQRDAYNDFITILSNQFENKFDKINSEVNNLKSEISELRRISRDQDQEISDLKNKLADLEIPLNLAASAQKSHSERLNFLDDQSRRNNLMFEGIDEDNTETVEHATEKIHKLVKDRLGISDKIEIDRVRRVGKLNHNKPRTILVNFRNFNDRQNILRNSKKLKNSNIFINEDLCEYSRLKRREQLPKLKEARAAGKIAYFYNNNLIVRDYVSESDQQPSQVVVEQQIQPQPQHSKGRGTSNPPAPATRGGGRGA